MGRTLHEVFRIREVRDHRTGGAVVALNPPDTGSNRDPEIDVLRLVQPIPGGRDRKFPARASRLSRVRSFGYRLGIALGYSQHRDAPTGASRPCPATLALYDWQHRCPTCLPPGGPRYLAQDDIPRRGRFAEATRSFGSSHRRIGLRLPSAPVASTISSVSRPRGINLMRWRASRLMVIRGANSDMLASTTLDAMLAR